MFKRLLRLPSGIRLIRPSMATTPLFRLKYSANNLNHPRFAFVISKNTAKTAVERNKSKRKIRACVEKRYNDFPADNDYIFILKSNLADIPFELICNEVSGLTRGLRKR